MIVRFGYKEDGSNKITYSPIFYLGQKAAEEMDKIPPPYIKGSAESVREYPFSELDGDFN